MISFDKKRSEGKSIIYCFCMKFLLITLTNLITITHQKSPSFLISSNKLRIPIYQPFAINNNYMSYEEKSLNSYNLPKSIQPPIFVPFLYTKPKTIKVPILLVIIDSPPIKSKLNRQKYKPKLNSKIKITSDYFPNSLKLGRPGIDYPNLATIPITNFHCKEQRFKGFFADPETKCQVWHYCDLNGGQASFLCPNGTIFNQVALTCDWWYNTQCSSTIQQYVINERLYKFILPFKKKFPEDYSGPIVDKFLTIKFQELEKQMALKRRTGNNKNVTLSS